ncbi:MAG: type II toxin-antitoxin system Phd/YefM family antitoxin [Patescibacteria group bacterium]
MNTISATNARAKLYDILDDVDKLSKRIAITSHGKTKAVLVNADELDGLLETLEIMSDKRAMASIKKSMEEIKEGKIIPLEEVIKDL